MILSELLWTAQLDIACGVVTQKDGTRLVISCYHNYSDAESGLLTMGMTMIMTIVTFPGGCCTSRETTGAGSFTGISQTTMGDFYLLHRPGFMKICFLFMIPIDTLTFMISWHHVSYIQHDYRQQHMSLISLR